MFRARNGWVRVSKRVPLVQTRPFCTNNNKPTAAANNNNGKAAGEASVRDFDAYRQLDKLDFMTAAKILFTTPTKKKKFGIDFHLVQFFFACLPSLAVYLVAQYARYEIRRMEAEQEQKKKAEEENKAKELESSATEEKETESDPELLQVKGRLDKLEETIKEIVAESKKQSDSSITEKQEDGTKKKNLTAIEPSNNQSRSGASNSASSDHISGSAAPVIDVSQQDQKGKTQNEEPSQHAKK